MLATTLHETRAVRSQDDKRLTSHDTHLTRIARATRDSTKMTPSTNTKTAIIPKIRKLLRELESGLDAIFRYDRDSRIVELAVSSDRRTQSLPRVLGQNQADERPGVKSEG